LQVPVTLADEKLYLELRTAIDNASAEVLAKIIGKDGFEEKYLDYLGLKELENKQAARVVDDLIANLSDEVNKTDKEAIENARTKYEQLTPAQKEFVTNLARLIQKEEELALLYELENMSAAESSSGSICKHF
jgi:DNA replication initiation complex subunit (GINS family)